MDPLETKKRIFAAHKLINEKTTTKQKFESIKTLIKGINPRIDKLLEGSSKALYDLEKLQKGELIELTAEHLPENTEEEKKRKKALLWFIRNWKSLKSEVERVKKEFELAQVKQDLKQQVTSGVKIIAFAKGPFGLITALAVIAVISLSVLSKKKTESNKTIIPPTNLTPTSIIEPTSSRDKIKVIIFNGKQIPLTELTIGQGLDCLDGKAEAPHYHAKNQTTVNALDGTIISDPGGCGFGKVSGVEVVEI